MLIKIVIYAVVIYLGFGIVALLFQKRLTYHPYPVSPSEVSLLGSCPWAQEIQFESSDGVVLHAVWVPPSEAETVLIFSHGNAGNLFGRLALLDNFRGAGLGVFLYDYRGYGRSGGRPSEQGLYRDSEAAWDWVTAHQGIEPNRIVSYGRSLGAAVALHLALSREVGAAVLDVPFTSVSDMAKEILPFFPLGPFLLESYDNLGRVGSLSCPLLVIVAENDQVVSPWMGKAVFEAAPQPKKLLVVRGSGHDDTPWVGAETYLQHVKDLTRSTRR